MAGRADRIADLEHLWSQWYRRARYVEYVLPGPEWINTGARWLTDEQVEYEHGPTEVWLTLAGNGGMVLAGRVEAKRPAATPEPEPDDLTTAVIDAYRAGSGMETIGHRLGISWRQVRNILTAAREPLRTRGQYHRAHREAGD